MVFDACSALCEGFVCWLKCLEGFGGLVLPMQLSLFLLDCLGLLGSEGAGLGDSSSKHHYVVIGMLMNHSRSTPKWGNKRSMRGLRALRDGA